MKENLRSQPYIAAGIKIQHGFECTYGKDDCIQLIEQWAALGGDGGLTETTMRIACGLKLRTTTSTRAHGLENIDKDCSQHTGDEGKEDGAVDPLGLVLNRVVQALMQKQENGISFNAFKYIGLPSGSPVGTKEEVWTMLVREGRLYEIHTRMSRTSQMFAPCIRTSKSLADICKLNVDDDNVSYYETLDVKALATYLTRISKRNHVAY